MPLQEIVINYLRQRNTDFAILIDGSWGSGKTYFVKNQLSHAIQKEQIESNDSKSKKFEAVYISLYGVSTLDELKQRLMIEVNPWMKSSIFKVSDYLVTKGFNIANVFTRGTLSKNDKDQVVTNIFGTIPKNKVLIFDDLERLQKDVLNETLGFINTYTEHQNLKVIVVEDENKIKESIESYAVVKEKLIRFTYLFKLELIDVFDDFSARYQDDYKNYLFGQKEFICFLFGRGQQSNLRTLRFVLDLNCQVFNEINKLVEIENRYKTKIQERILFFMITYSIVYKLGATTDDLKGLLDLSSEISGRSKRMNSIMASLLKKNDKSNPNITPAGIFRKRFEEMFLQDNNRMAFEYFSFLAFFIQTGDLDNEALKSSCLNMQKIIQNFEQLPELKSYSQLQSPLKLNDEDLSPVIADVMRFVVEGTYKLAMYPRIFASLEEMAAYGFDGFNIDNELIERFRAGMQKASQNSRYDKELEMHLSMIENSSKEFDNLAEYCMSLNNQLISPIGTMVSGKIIQALKDADYQKIRESLKDELFYEIPKWQKSWLNPQVFVDLFNDLPNTIKLDLIELLKNDVSFQANQHKLVGDLDFITSVNTIINDQLTLTDRNRKISTYLLKLLGDYFNSQIALIQPNN